MERLTRSTPVKTGMSYVPVSAVTAADVETAPALDSAKVTRLVLRSTSRKLLFLIAGLRFIESKPGFVHVQRKAPENGFDDEKLLDLIRQLESASNSSGNTSQEVTGTMLENAANNMVRRKINEFISSGIQVRGAGKTDPKLSAALPSPDSDLFLALLAEAKLSFSDNTSQPPAAAATPVGLRGGRKSGAGSNTGGIGSVVDASDSGSDAASRADSSSAGAAEAAATCSRCGQQCDAREAYCAACGTVLRLNRRSEAPPTPMASRAQTASASDERARVGGAAAAAAAVADGDADKPAAGKSGANKQDKRSAATTGSTKAPSADAALAPAAADPFCQQCGRDAASPLDAYCSHCGTRLVLRPRAQPLAPAPAPASAPAPAPPAPASAPPASAPPAAASTDPVQSPALHIQYLPHPATEAQLVASPHTLFVPASFLPLVPRDDILLLDKRLGEGSFGEVVLGKWRGLKVALKILKLDAQLDGLHLSRELLALERTSKSVDTVSTYGVSLQSNEIWLLMEYLEDFITLRDWINSSRHLYPLSVARRADVLRVSHNILRGLADHHRVGVVHRDPKLDNIMMKVNGHDVRWLDFGLAKLASTSQPFETALCGTLINVAPESWRDSTFTDRSDVFGLSVALYSFFTGGLAFPNGEHLLPNFAEKVEKGMRPDLRLIRFRDDSGVPVPDPDLQHLLQHMWTDLPEDRWSAEECRLYVCSLLDRCGHPL